MNELFAIFWAAIERSRGAMAERLRVEAGTINSWNNAQDHS